MMIPDSKLDFSRPLDGSLGDEIVRQRTFLEKLFQELRDRQVVYVLLRGYEAITTRWRIDTDLDLAVSQDHLHPLLSVLLDLSQRLGYEKRKVIYRPGVLRLLLVDNESQRELPIDIWFEFRYIGLEYLDVDQVLIKRRQLDASIWVPSCEYEVAASLMKELLHTGKIADKKLLSAKNKMDARYVMPFEKFFDVRIAEELAVSVREGVGEVSDLRRKALFICIYKNIVHFGILRIIGRTAGYIFARFWGYGDPMKKLKRQ